MSKRNVRDLYLEIVKSSEDSDWLSVRMFSPSKGRLSASELKSRLVEAGYRPGDQVRLSLCDDEDLDS